MLTSIVLVLLALMLTTIALVFLLLVCGYAYFWWQHPARRCFAKLPAYPNLPVIGSFFSVYGDGELLQNLDDIKTVSNNFIEKPYYYKFASAWVGDGLVTASGDIWKRNIKKLAGAFTGNIVDGFQDVFNYHAKKLVRCLKAEVDQEPFDVMSKYLAATTLEAICQTALGVPKISDNIGTHEYYSAFTRMIELILRRGVNILMHLDFIFYLTPAKRELDKCVEIIHNVCKTIMQKRQEREEYLGNSEPKKCNFKSYLDVILELNAKDPTFTEKQVRDEINTIIVAGQETVATTLFYTLLMIGCKPGVQDKLHREMIEIFGESKRDVTKEDLTRMSYCEAVINETLRLFPPAPGVMRYADRDLQLESCVIPKGTTCTLNFYGVGRSKRYWGPDALEFNPERWLSDSVPASALLAFSTGKRSCIGKKYAMSLMKTVIAHCVRELVVTSEADNIKLKIDVALRPLSGHLIEVELRDN